MKAKAHGIEYIRAIGASSQDRCGHIFGPVKAEAKAHSSDATSLSSLPLPPTHTMLSSEIFLAPDKLEAGLAVHVALDVQLAAQHLGSAEEHPRLGRGVDLADAPEHRVPIGPPEVRGRAEAGDGILIRICVVDHDIRSIVRHDLGG